MKLIKYLPVLLMFVACSHAQEKTQAPINSTKQSVQNNSVKDSLKQVLSPKDFEITCNSGTEPAFSGKYWNYKKNGNYNCKVCGALLFESDHKYQSGSGWPSFYQTAADSTVSLHDDYELGVKRIEIRCGKCEAHLGHVFEDGPMPTGKRFCVNSASLNFETKNKSKKNK